MSSSQFIRRWVFRPLFSLIIAGILLEILLQVGAITVWLFSRHAAAIPSSTPQKVILCVGDSFTYGLGSSSANGSYPAQLQKFVGKDWKVINQGWPGQSSAEIVRSIDQLLVQYHPSIVLIMTGINDTWSPETYKIDQSQTSYSVPGRFHWRWRTPRLFALIKAHAEVVWVEWRKQHTTASTPKTMTPPPAKRISAKPPAQIIKTIIPKPQQADQAMAEDSAKNAKLQAIVDRGWKAFHDRDLKTAESCFTQAARVEWKNQSAAYTGLVNVYKAQERRDKAEEALAWLRSNYTKKLTGVAGLSLAQALGTLGPTKEAVELEANLVKKYPDLAWLWIAYASDSFTMGDKKTALEAVNRACDLTSDSDGDSKGYFYYWKAKLLKDERPEEALSFVIRGYLLDGKKDQLALSLATGKKTYSMVNFERLLDSLTVPQQQRYYLREAYARATTSNNSQVLNLLQVHLQQIVDACRARNAQPIFVNYPFVSSNEKSMQKVAEDNGIPFINVRLVFDELLKTKKKEDLFVPDNHCNDRGYSVIASSVGESIKKYHLL